GLGGSPSDGQCWVAAVKASWTASSATSMLPKTRTRTETARPYSARKTRSISDAARTGMSSVLGDVLERAHLYRQGGSPGRFTCPVKCGVQIGCGDDPEPADVFHAFDVRSIGGDHIICPRPHHRSRARGV